MTKKLLSQIFNYDDYRRFLADYFAEQKQHRSIFSHRYFASKAGFSSSSFCLSVIKGRFNLSPDATQKMVTALELDPRQKQYFASLVTYNQSKKPAEREEAWFQLEELRKQTKFIRLSDPQHLYFSRWYYPVLRELAIHPSWDGDYIALARRLDPALTTEEVRDAVADLVKWNLILPDGDRFKSSHPLLNAEGVAPADLRQIKREYLQLGLAALDTKGPAQRFATFSTLAMSEDSYEFAVKTLEEARARIIARAAGDAKVEKIYEMSLQVFPLTRHLAEKQS